MTTVSHRDETSIKKLFVGKQIVKTKTKNGEGILVLNDGTQLTITPNSGCWGCISGNFTLKELNKIKNVITNVKPVRKNKNGTVYQLFLYVEGVEKKQKLFSITGTDGNGYYGTGYTIEVTQ